MQRWYRPFYTLYNLITLFVTPHKQIHLFNHSFAKHLMSIYPVLETILAKRVMELNKTQPFFKEFMMYWKSSYKHINNSTSWAWPQKWLRCREVSWRREWGRTRRRPRRSWASRMNWSLLKEPVKRKKKRGRNSRQKEQHCKVEEDFETLWHRKGSCRSLMLLEHKLRWTVGEGWKVRREWDDTASWVPY